LNRLKSILNSLITNGAIIRLMNNGIWGGEARRSGVHEIWTFDPQALKIAVKGFMFFF